ncbi:MAG: hypothetical protein KGI33_11570 [Thaumarchaeota archaeon]|nr:hypothetical protein [Nitrososphaerota archaeon]
MQDRNPRMIIITAALALALASASLAGHAPIPALAQENATGTGIQTQAPNGPYLHNPCLPYGYQGHGMHRGQPGNRTAFHSHPPRPHAAWTGNWTRHWQNGNHAAFMMPPCPPSIPADPGNANSTTITQSPAQNSSTTNPIPSWVRNNAKWWSQGQMGDSDFIQGVQFLIKQGIMKIPPTAAIQTAQPQPIPAWVKTSAKWWSQGEISDDDFIKGIQYLVSTGIIKA